jgi:type IV pilus assembly protein PilM
VAEVELKGGADPRDGAILHAYAERAIPAGVIREGEIEEPGMFASTLQEVFSSAKVSSKKVTVALGHPSVVVREVDVPAQPMADIRSSLAFHVQESLPMAVDESLLDFYPNLEIETASGPALRGLLVASPRDRIRNLLDSLDAANVGLHCVDHAAFAMWRAGIRGELLYANVALVDVGATKTTVVISQQGAPRLVRVLPQGGNDATRAIISAFKGSTFDAEAVKREVGMTTQATGEGRVVAEAAAHAMGPLIESIRNTLVYFAGSNPGGAAERIVLTGGGAYLNGFGQALSSATRLPVMIGDPLAGVVIGKKVDVNQFRGREASLATIVGLAMGDGR